MQPEEKVKPTLATLVVMAVGLQQAARMVGVSTRSMQNFVAAKLIPSRKIGKRRLILVRDLERFLRTDQPLPVSKPNGDSHAR
jgi:hypothetical protein